MNQIHGQILNRNMCKTGKTHGTEQIRKLLEWKFIIV
jgi:hypothetical protein